MGTSHGGGKLKVLIIIVSKWGKFTFLRVVLLWWVLQGLEGFFMVATRVMAGS